MSPVYIPAVVAGLAGAALIAQRCGVGQLVVMLLEYATLVAVTAAILVAGLALS